MNGPDERLLHERDAAHYLGMSVAWLRRKRWEGDGPAYVRHGRAVRYEPTALRRWVEAHRVGGSERADSRPEFAWRRGGGIR